MNISNDKRLLILDDSEDLLWILKIFFEGKGYTVKSLPDADKIYSVIDTFYPDLLLMDVLLNGNDGRDICQKLRSNSHTKHLGILLTSAS
ncbi:MAG: response regulator, partial [Ferruginibacter sp.]